MNILDKTINFFNPEAGFKRQQFRNATGFINGFGTEYETTTSAPHYNIEVSDMTADDDIAALSTARATARKYYNNNGFYGGVIECATDHVIGAGLRAKSTIIAKNVPDIAPERIMEIENQLNTYFKEWSESTICDITGKDTFTDMQRLAYSSYKVDGDMFALLPIRTIGESKVLQVNQIDAQFIQSGFDSSFVEGIKTSKEKMPLQYSILQADNTYKNISAFKNGKRNVIHLFKRKRAKQLRGLPFLNAVTRDTVYIDDFMKYELTASKLAAVFFGSIKTAAKDQVFGEQKDLLGGSGQTKQTQSNTVKENSITQLMPGDELNIHQQGRDNANFGAFINTCLQKVSSNTRIPLELILAQFVSSYSASRAALMQMMKFVKPERQMFVNTYCKPIREQVLIWAILNNELNIPEFATHGKKLLTAMWIGEAMGSVDPGKDVKANIEAIKGNLKTYEQATIELGNGEFESNTQILKEELPIIAELNKIGEPQDANN